MISISSEEIKMHMFEQPLWSVVYLVKCIWERKVSLIDQSHKSNNAPVPYPHNVPFVTEMWRVHVHISATKWRVVDFFCCGICEMGLC